MDTKKEVILEQIQVAKRKNAKYLAWKEAEYAADLAAELGIADAHDLLGSGRYPDTESLRRAVLALDDVVIVTRHQGVVEWLKEHGVNGKVVSHAASDDVRDRHVYGNLPLHLAAETARVTTISLPDLQPEQRGKDLTPAEMDEAGATLETYEIRRLS